MVEAKASSSSLWDIDGSMLDGLPLLASVRYKAKEYRMEGRSGKRVGVAGARENAAQSPRAGERQASGSREHAQ